MRPPLTCSVWPVMKPERSEARNAQAQATSSGVPQRPAGTASGPLAGRGPGALAAHVQGGGGDQVGGDAVAPEVGGERLREAEQAGLACERVEPAGGDAEAAADVDDAAPAPLDHRGRDRLREVERGVEVGRERASPVLGADVEDALVRAGGGVAHVDVDRGEAPQRLADERVHRVRVADIAERHEGVRSERAGLVRHRLGLGAVAARVDDDVCATSRELDEDGAAEVAAGAGDERGLALEIAAGLHALAPLAAGAGVLASQRGGD